MIHYLIVDSVGTAFIACKLDEVSLLNDDTRNTIAVSRERPGSTEGATHDAYYHIPQGECCIPCSIAWQRNVKD